VAVVPASTRSAGGWLSSVRNRRRTELRLLVGAAQPLGEVRRPARCWLLTQSASSTANGLSL
jgi:hypothetical protein